MKRALALLIAAPAVLGLSAGSSASHAAPRATCLSARVHDEANPALGTLSGGRWVQASPASTGLVGYLWEKGEILNGRFAAFVGGVNPSTRYSQKVLWAAPSTASHEEMLRARLTLTGVRLSPRPKARFIQHFTGAYSDQTPGQLFPSILKVPRAGCWKLSLRARGVSASIVVFARRAHG
jgi:hypothetical protein